jgi:hypothetical protein
MYYGGLVMRLLDIFTDCEIIVNSWTRKPTYPAKYRILPKPNPKTLTLQDLQQYVANLQQRYPERGFYLRKHRNMYVITQKMVIIPEEIKQEINLLKTRLNQINKCLYQSTVNKYEKIIVTNTLRELKSKITRKHDAIPIYIDLQNQRFYVPQIYIKTKPKLTAYIIMKTLGALGITQSKYIGRGK